MEERLYCADYSAIFGPDFANPFQYPAWDALLWPLVTDVELPEPVNRLLSLNPSDHPLFYRRKISLEELALEYQCSGVGGACVQAMEIGRDYGIPNEFVHEFCEGHPDVFKPVYSYDLASEPGDFVSALPGDAVAVVVYPTYSGPDSLYVDQGVIDKIIGVARLLAEKGLPLKIELGNMYLPENNTSYSTPEVIRYIVSRVPDEVIILAGIDLLGNGQALLNLLRYERNLWIQIDPRTFGGMSPTSFFEMLFGIPGFVQNSWSRIIIGSATPTLEASQVVRGFYYSTAELDFAQRNILRAWGFKNIHRIMPLNTRSDVGLGDIGLARPATLGEMALLHNGPDSTIVQMDIVLESFSITQLLSIKSIIEEAVGAILDVYPEHRNGEIIVKSYHTTTTLLVNEHEYGNYLQLHYLLAEESMRDPGKAMHTVAALENRADFNFPDHLIASSYGQRVLYWPIVDGKIKFGGREHPYVLVTFGPRSLKLSITVTLFN